MSPPIVPEALADRYGRSASRPGRRRWVYWTLLGAFILAGIGVAIAYYRNFGAEPISTQDTGFQILDNHRVRVSFTVTRNDPGRAADCLVRSRDAQGSETGRREVYIPPATDSITVSTVLRTVARASTGESYGCSYHVPPYLSRTSPPSG
ncbi:MAG: DUF4307 domain-containing protein [Sciscionella sp.]